MYFSLSVRAEGFIYTLDLDQILGFHACQKWQDSDLCLHTFVLSLALLEPGASDSVCILISDGSHMDTDMDAFHTRTVYSFSEVQVAESFLKVRSRL